MLTLEDIYEIYVAHKDDYNARVEEFTIGHKTFNFNSQTSLLGVINLSTDSWFNHAVCYHSEQAIRRAKILTAQGADIVDIGAEASSQHTQRADQVKQTSQLLPILKTLSQEGILTSVETYHPEVARECLKAGANVINFTGTEKSEEMYQVVAEFDAAIIMCYIQGKHARDVGEFDFTLAKDPIEFLYNYFGKETEIATKLGVKKIFIDPAVGLGYSNFYYKYEYVSKRLNYQIKSLLSAFRLRKLGFPVFNQIPTALEVFAEEVRSAQVFTSVFAALGKNDILRTHEVSKVKAVLETMSLM
ncbi:dihydropteroate synthase [Lyngbya sp. CCY1209]|jgi:dihydropteroate synthase|uniref:dihydropteroate synthase n=1 Tax=Lyngbya sp. CCY1209 TaxID=2886103 RepID=UPI002D20C2E0|nr:dihydropteroate synthase [Lyngbya sp. CCY1209]MEB3885994.1 dihydropteroate synthase [Lyngbya sp. CCY1209]